MKVRELIKFLEKQNQDDIVYLVDLGMGTGDLIELAFNGEEKSDKVIGDIFKVQEEITDEFLIRSTY